MQVFLIFVVIFLTACTQPATNTIAEKNGFQSRYIQTSKFNLASYQKIKKPGAPVNVYIEGDGRAWISRSMLSRDPSPQASTVISLAALDPNPNVVYLARPCQFSPQDLKTVCSAKYWSSARYSSEVVTAINMAITKIKQQSKAKRINLIGFSGGAALAILVASQRTDIASIRTVAGNLDLMAMEKHHKTTALHESMDPIKIAKKVRHIPQLHFCGAKDKVVPNKIAQNFVQAAGLDQSKVIIIKQAGHSDGWNAQWPALLKIVP